MGGDRGGETPRGACPAQAARANEKTVARILKAHRIRPVRGSAAHPAPAAACGSVGTVEATIAHIRAVAARLRLVNQQIKKAERRLDEHCAATAAEDLRAARRRGPIS